MKKLITRLIAVVCSIGGFAASAAPGDIISYNFAQSDTEGNGLAFEAQQTLLGEIPLAAWSQITPHNQTMTSGIKSYNPTTGTIVDVSGMSIKTLADGASNINIMSANFGDTMPDAAHQYMLTFMSRLNNAGDTQHVAIHGVPYAKYDIYLYFSGHKDIDNGTHRAFKVDGATSDTTVDADGNPVAGSSAWGVKGNATPALGTNVVVFKNRFSPSFSIDGSVQGGGVAAIQIIDRSEAMGSVTFTDIYCRADSNRGVGNYRPASMTLPASLSYPAGTYFKVKTVSLAMEAATTVPAASIKIGDVRSTSVSEEHPAWSIGYKVTYTFDDPVTVAAGETLPMSAYNESDEETTFRLRLFKTTAACNSAITYQTSMDQWRPAYEIEAEIAVPTVLDYTAEQSVTISKMNADAAGCEIVQVKLAPGATIVCDQTPALPVKHFVASEGSITLSAATKPEGIESLNLSNVKGAVKRSWLTMPTNGVMGFNFNASACRNGAESTDNAANDTGLALEIGDWVCDQRLQNGTSTTMFADGLSVLTWKASNLYTENGTCSNFIQGYLDDTQGVLITLSNVPYETYDVIIYCSTDDATKSFTSKVVNGKIYTWDAETGATKEVSSATTWGLASAAAGKAVLGANTLRVKDLTGPLSIESLKGNNARGCISAIQIMPSGTSTAPTMTIEGEVSWTDASKWDTTEAPTAGNVIIKTTGDCTITIDTATVTLGGITVEGAGKLTFLTSNGGTLTASAISTTGSVAIGAGITIDTIPAEVTYLAKVTSLVTSTYGAGATYEGGAGTDDSPVPFTFNSNGKMTLTGSEPFYLDQTHGAAASTVNFSSATLYALNAQPEAHGFGVGHQTYTFTGTTTLEAAKFVLGQGGANRTSVFTMGDTSAVTVTGTANMNNNTSSIMFGHWDSATTFTIKDEAKFSAPETDVLIALTGNNQTININGGTMDVRGFKVSTGANGTNVMNLNGGALKLGATGITSYGSPTMTINLNGSVELTTAAETVPVTQPIVQGENGVLVKKGEGKLLLGTSRPCMDVQAGTVQLTATTEEQAAGELVLPVAENAAAASADKVSIVDANGVAIEIQSVSEIDEETHTITITLKTNAFDENTATSEWTELSGTVIVSGTEESPTVLTFDAAVPEAVTQIDVIGVVEIVVNEGLQSYGAVTLNITPGATAIIKGPYPFAEIKGTGDLVFDPGAGKEMTVNTNNNAFTGPCTIASGVVKMGGNNRCLGQWNMNRLILVKSGATLDENGVKGGEQAQSYRITLEEGAALVNTGASYSGDLKLIVTSGLTLRGNATVSSETSVGGGCHYNYYQSPINIGEYTLTKTGAGIMYYTSPSISGTGTIDVQAGTFTVARTYGGAQPTFANGTLVIGSGSGLNLMSYQGDTSFTVKNLTMNGSVTKGSSSVLTVNGVLTGAGTMPAVTLGTAATLKVDGKRCLTFNGPITLGDGDTLALDLSGIDLAKTSSIPLLRVTDAENLPAVDQIDGVPAKWKLVKTADGLGYKLSKPSFVVIIK